MLRKLVVVDGQTYLLKLTTNKAGTAGTLGVFEFQDDGLIRSREQQEKPENFVKFIAATNKHALDNLKQLMKNF